MPRLSSESLVQRFQTKQRKKVERLGRPPVLADIVAEGSAGDVDSYARRKRGHAKKIGAVVDLMVHPQEEIPEVLARIDRQGRHDGVIVSMPLPDRRHDMAVRSHIPKRLDTEGLRPDSRLLPPTSEAMFLLPKHYGLKLGGNIVVHGNGSIGSGVVRGLKRRGFTPTAVIDFENRDELGDAIEEADFVFSAVGVSGSITAAMVRRRMRNSRPLTIVDAGVSFVSGKQSGDVDPTIDPDDFPHLHLSPATGGVGGVTACVGFDRLIATAFNAESMAA